LYAHQPIADGLAETTDCYVQPVPTTVPIGPDGALYVVEFDRNGWFAATAGEAAVGGTIERCDVDTGDCTLTEDADVTLGAITFDRWGQMWVLENTTPEVATVRRVDVP